MKAKENIKKLGPQQDNAHDQIRDLKIELGRDEKELDQKLKDKFKFISGHNKLEKSPGIFMEEDKVKKNIRQRILIPAKRVTNCLQSV